MMNESGAKIVIANSTKGKGQGPSFWQFGRDQYAALTLNL